MIDTYPIKPSFTLIYLFLLLLLFFTLTLTHPFSFSLVLLSRLLKFSPIWNSWLNFLVFYLFFSQLSFLTQFVFSLISPPSTQFVSLKKNLCSPICSYGFFFFFGCIDVKMFLVRWVFFFFFFWGGIYWYWLFPENCDFSFYIFFLCWLFLWEDCDFSFFFSVKVFGVVFLWKTQEFSNFLVWDAWAWF